MANDVSPDPRTTVLNVHPSWLDVDGYQILISGFFTKSTSLVCNQLGSVGFAKKDLEVPGSRQSDEIDLGQM